MKIMYFYVHKNKNILFFNFIIDMYYNGNRVMVINGLG